MPRTDADHGSIRDLITLLKLKRDHVQRLSSRNGALGELDVLASDSQYLPRPKGRELANLMQVLRDAGTSIKPSSFDILVLPEAAAVDFLDQRSIGQNLQHFTFIEVKTANQERVRPDFSGFFFAFTESEIAAADILKDRHRVLLRNKLTGATLVSSVPELLSRAKSTNWQVSIQL